MPSVLEPVISIKRQSDIHERAMNDVVDDHPTVNRLRMLNVDLAAWVAAVIATGQNIQGLTCLTTSISATGRLIMFVMRLSGHVQSVPLSGGRDLRCRSRLDTYGLRLG